MRANPMWVWRRMLPAVIVAAFAQHAVLAQTDADRQRQAEMALDQYGAAKTAGERAAVIEYLQHLDRDQVAGAVVDHSIGSQNGTEATIYNRLVEVIAPEGCAALLDRLKTVDLPAAKGKLIVALRHCQGRETILALQGCLDDKRPVLFAAGGPNPRRICDLAYDELFLKLRSSPQFGLDSSPRMKGVITEKTPIKARDAEIAKLKARLVLHPPAPAPSIPPESGRSATAVTLL